MSDFAKQLRKRKLRVMSDAYEAIYEAADRIEQLEAALEFYACECQPGQCENGPLESNRDTVSCGHRARAALAKKPIP